jgi:hypothetical protein
MGNRAGVHGGGAGAGWWASLFYIYVTFSTTYFGRRCLTAVSD